MILRGGQLRRIGEDLRPVDGDCLAHRRKLRENGWLALRAGLPIADNPRIGRELLIVRDTAVQDNPEPL